MKILQCLMFTALLLHAASFDVASVKPSDAGTRGSGVDTDNGLLRMHNVTLKRAMVAAYGIPEAQILGSPKSMDDLRYEIVARNDQRTSEDELMGMLQSLLAERFKLSFHREQQTLPGYALTVAKGGMKATPSEPDGNSTTNGSRGRIEAKGCPMSRLVMKLSGLLGVPVVDMTDDMRSFDFTLQWVPDDMLAKAGAGSDAPGGPTLFTALQEQLGLKLEARKVPVDVLVIDHAEPASEN